MSDENSIGLVELIKQVEQELLFAETEGKKTAPIFSVDTVELELQVTIRKQGQSGIKIYVVQVGGSVGRDDVQKLKVTLTPLLSKEERIQIIKQRYPEAWKAIEQATVRATTKEGREERLSN